MVVVAAVVVMVVTVAVFLHILCIFKMFFQIRAF